MAGKNIQHLATNQRNLEFLVSALTTQEAGYLSSQEAVGKSVAEYSGQFRGHIVGVVNDINIYSLHREPYSIIYAVTPIQNHKYLSIRMLPWPVAYYAMHRWLQNFAYRVMTGWQIFLVSAGVALSISVLTVSFQSIKAALTNPTDSLRYE